MRFLTTENIGTKVGDLHPADHSQGNGRAFFYARDREPLGGVARIEDLAYDESILGGKFECSPQRGTQATANIASSQSSVAFIKEPQRHNAVHKASDKDTPFDPGGAYSPVAVAVAFLVEGGDGVVLRFARLFFLFTFA